MSRDEGIDSVGIAPQMGRIGKRQTGSKRYDGLDRKLALKVIVESHNYIKSIFVNII